MDSDLWDINIGERKAAAERLFPGGRVRLREVAVVIATCHPYALDYLKQAPVLAALAWAASEDQPIRFGHPHVGKQLLHRVASVFAHQCQRGFKLRKLLEFYLHAANMAINPLVAANETPHVGALQIRALKGAGMRTSYVPIVLELARLNPSMLAQIIPDKANKQEAWLRFMAAWHSQMMRRFGRFELDQLASLAQAMSSANYTHAYQGQHLADYLLAQQQAEAAGQPHHFDCRCVSWEDISVSVAEWDNMMRESLKPGANIEADYTPLPNAPTCFTVPDAGVFEFVPLRSALALGEEGKAMHHCVASYSRDVLTGLSRIFSVRRNDQRVATMEIVFRDREPRGYRISQLKGPCNASVKMTPGLNHAIALFSEEYQRKQQGRS